MSSAFMGEFIGTMLLIILGGGVVANYDPAIKQDGKLLTEGFIALQSEGQPVDFRNIKILDLKPKSKK